MIGNSSLATSATGTVSPSSAPPSWGGDDPTMLTIARLVPVKRVVLGDHLTLTVPDVTSTGKCIGTNHVHSKGLTGRLRCTEE